MDIRYIVGDVELPDAVKFPYSVSLHKISTYFDTGSSIFYKIAIFCQKLGCKSTAYMAVSNINQPQKKLVWDCNIVHTDSPPNPTTC